MALLHDIEATMVPDTFGAAMKYDADALTKAGILGKDSLHSEKEGTTRGMINFTKLSMLHHGAIRQVHQQLQDVKEFYQDKIAALESRLMRLEA
jgi:orotidine-5'-phosphate decarboxylase